MKKTSVGKKVLAGAFAAPLIAARTICGVAHKADRASPVVGNITSSCRRNRSNFPQLRDFGSRSPQPSRGWAQAAILGSFPPLLQSGSPRPAARSRQRVLSRRTRAQSGCGRLRSLSHCPGE